MPGETNLPALLRGMQPELSADEFVYAHLLPGMPAPELQPLAAIIDEREGRTLILTMDAAEAAGLPYTYPCRRITLNVHSSLEAVGLLAHIATALAEAGISANCVSGYFHDHLFISTNHAERALEILSRLSEPQ